jgi:hypothetical protein
MKKTYSLFICAFIFQLSLQAQKTPSLTSSSGAKQSPPEQVVRSGLRGKGSSEWLSRAGISFTQNKGQVADMDGSLRPDILFKGDGGGTDVYIRKTGISYVLNNMSEVIHQIDEQVEEKIKAGEITEQDEQKLKQVLEQKAAIKIHRLDLDFVGGNPNPETISAHQVEGYTNYYYGHCPNGITHVNSYNIVTTKNIYENIDVKYFGAKDASTGLSTRQGLKYDIVVNPGADPNQIKLKYTGAEELKIKNGKLIIKTGLGDVSEYMPKVYQNINGKIVDVKAAYNLKGSVVNFVFGTSNPSFPLVIDPWVTYYGGSNDDFGVAITSDPSGNVVFTGYTSSVGFPVITGGFQTAMAGGAGTDAFLVKMDANGIPLFSTFLGGTGFDRGDGIATDLTGNICVAGYTNSTDLPVGFSGANIVYKSTIGGGGDAFLFKFDPTGALLWGTYYGGSGADDGTDVCTDGINVFLYGYTLSATAISSGAGSFQPAIAASQDVFVVNFAPNGTRTWATYVGGTNIEVNGGIDCDPAGNIYIGGSTISTNFPFSPGAHQTTNGGARDAFLFKFNPAGVRLWATYYGGTAFDEGLAITCDLLGNVIIGGRARSTNAISFGSAYQTILAGNVEDAFIAKFNGSGVLQWGTYLGGVTVGVSSANDYCTGLDCDINNNIIAGGDTYSTDFPVTNCAYQTVFRGSEDQWIATFKPNGQLMCSGYIGEGVSGSPNNETKEKEGGSIVVSGAYVYLVANTTCNYPVTSGAYQTICGGLNDCAIAKLCITSCGENALAINFTNTTSVCVGSGIIASVNNTSCDTTQTTYLWTFTGATPSSSTSQNPSGIIYSTPGTYPIKVVVSTPCGKDSLTKSAAVVVNSCGCNLSAQFIKGTANCMGCGCKEWIMVTASGGTTPYSYSWPNGYNKRYQNKLCPGAYIINVVDTNGCSINVTINAP